MALLFLSTASTLILILYCNGISKSHLRLRSYCKFHPNYPQLSSKKSLQHSSLLCLLGEVSIFSTQRAQIFFMCKCSYTISPTRSLRVPCSLAVCHNFIVRSGRIIFSTFSAAPLKLATRGEGHLHSSLILVEKVVPTFWPLCTKVQISKNQGIWSQCIWSQCGVQNCVILQILTSIKMC